MTVTESRSLKVGSRVLWHGNASDSGTVIDVGYHAVTISWDMQQTGTIAREDMGSIVAAKETRPCECENSHCDHCDNQTSCPERATAAVTFPGAGTFLLCSKCNHNYRHVARSKEVAL